MHVKVCYVSIQMDTCMMCIIIFVMMGFIFTNGGASMIVINFYTYKLASCCKHVSCGYSYIIHTFPCMYYIHIYINLFFINNTNIIFWAMYVYIICV